MTPVLACPSRLFTGLIVALTLACAVPVLVAAEPANLLQNGSLANRNDKGLPADWGLEVTAGKPALQYETLDGQPVLRVDLPDNSACRLGQRLRLPELHYYVFTCEYRRQPAAPGQRPPELAVRIGFETPKDFWRVWVYGQPADIDGQWQKMSLDVMTPNNLGKGGLSFWIGEDRTPGTIWIRNARVEEIPLTEYQKSHAYQSRDGDTYFPQAKTAPPPRNHPAAVGPLCWWTSPHQDGVTDHDVADPARLNQPLAIPVAGSSQASTVCVLDATRSLGPVALSWPRELPELGRIDVQALKVWRQRVWIRSGFYYDIPELIEPLAGPVTLEQGGRLQLFVTVTAKPGAKAGRHALTIDAKAHDGALARIPVEVQVQPFDLAPAPREITFGLYPDPGRWEKYSDAELDAELQWLRSYGINSLLLYLPLGRIAEFKPLTAENLDTALAGWRAAMEKWGDRYMTRFVQAGFGPSYVCNIQSLSKAIARAGDLPVFKDGQYNPVLRDYLQRFTRVIEEVRVARSWPTFYYHYVDEPGGGTNVQATAEFALLEEMKLPGFTTANLPQVVRDFAGTLEIFAVGAGNFRHRSTLEHMRQWLAPYPRAQLWHYGAAGTYSGQEGSMGPNRWGSGFFMWRIGATGGFAWTYQRATGDPYDDFDAGGKDCCLTYPRREGKGSISTLQWEAMREGVIDYRYLRHLESAIAAGKASGDPARQAKAQAIERDLSVLRESLWQYAYEWPTTAQLGAWRAQVARWITDLNP